MKDEVKESNEYENFVNQKNILEMPESLVDFIEVSDAESDNPNRWQDHWRDMPEFENEENKSFKKLIVHFRTKQDYDDFVKLLNQSMTDKTKSIWYPELDKDENSLKRWVEE